MTDAGVIAAAILQQALDALPGMAVAVFGQTPSNPTEAAAALYREARMNMMSASAQGALAFRKGVGCVHSLSHMQPMAYGMGIGAIEDAAM